MKTASYLAIIIVAGSVCNPTCCKAVTNLPSFLREEAEIYVEAYQSKDYETCFRMMGAGLVNALGGKITVLNHYRSTEEALRRHHLKLETITVDEPQAVVSRGASDRYVVIPERHIYIAEDGNKYILNSYILAVSENNGRSWSMLEGSWRISEHIKNRDLALYDRLKLPIRKIYQADDPNIMMLEKGGSFMTPPETIKYKQSLRQRNNPLPPQPRRLTTY
ncbi:MAG: hypothetical protein Q7J98_11285 [Kiritimatiellia bacterium]|nr:hypothetical protein [Kiritimatiellia bacterium]